MLRVSCHGNMYTLACMAQTLLAPEVDLVVMETMKHVSSVESELSWKHVHPGLYGTDTSGTRGRLSCHGNYETCKQC